MSHWLMVVAHGVAAICGWELGRLLRRVQERSDRGA